MAQTAFHIKCEEEDLAPCQSSTDDTNQEVNGNGPNVPKQLLPTVLQPIPVVVDVVPGQPVYLATQTISATTKSTGTTLRFVLPIGQTVALLTSEAQGPSAEPANVTVPALVSSKTSSQTMKLVSSVQAPKPQAQKPAGSTVATEVFPRAKIPDFCSRCGAAYRVVQTLRGYMCQCNPQLIKSVQALSSRAKKKKFKHGSPACLKHITTSEIPEGDPIPGSGDYDKHGKLIMLVEDFYYGKDPGKPVLNELNQVPVKMKCTFCKKKLKNNIKMINHMKHHMEMERKRSEVDFHTVCQYCFRSFGSPFSLQCHVETVHSQAEYPSLCKICELSYEDTPLYLNHMKKSHKPGEMPYICKVCKFRSSFYQDVINHFKDFHKDTNLLLCPYCLTVFKSNNSYQLHYSKHQKRSVFNCKKCRLQFLYTRDIVEHKALHQTHLKPMQLKGLKPGTRVTIRAYAITKVNNSTTFNEPDMNCERTAKVLSPMSEPPRPSLPVSAPQKAPTNRKPVESLLKVVTKFQSRCDLGRKYSCIECNFDIPDFSSHFPTFVRCCLCRYSTCCSRAYANHMISSHGPRKTTTKYLNLYKDCPKFGKLSCCYCDYTTGYGDWMARHIAKHPEHSAKHCKLHDGFSAGYKRFVFIPTDLIRRSLVITQGSVTTLAHPIPQPAQPVPHSTQCKNLLPSSAQTPSLSTEVQPVDQFTVTKQNCETQPGTVAPQDTALSSVSTQAEPTQGGTLTLAQLKIVLYALCFGIPQAANQFDTQPEEIQTLLIKHQGRKIRKSLTPQVNDQLVEWVLCQREQQLPVDEASLFSKASEFMGANGGLGISYEWAADFLIHHELSLQALPTSCRQLPHKAQERLNSFSRFTNKQLTSQRFGPSSIGAMDELSIFIDMDQLDPASADSFSMLSAFRLTGDMDPLIDVVLAASADGTMLPTMVFFKGEPISTDVLALPDSIILEAKPDGISEEERLQLWFDKVWSQHINSSSKEKRLLVMDTYKGHLSDNFLALLYSADTMPNIIPSACSSRLQPLEACVGIVLREFLQARWNQHVTESPQDLIGAEPADLAFLLSVWLLEMLDVLAAKPELLQRSFEQVLSSTQELAPASFPKLVRSLTEALIVDPLPEQEFMEKDEENSSMPSVSTES
ncbi:pogo transposable element with ZNF domain [Trichomycterus rosablanca]|uniref:pogo transposable element with ZNF domain n=1 Tax=Trichomycterus rosablanca TaxID=2290929 RepID=UPI002F355777